MSRSVLEDSHSTATVPVPLILILAVAKTEPASPPESVTLSEPVAAAFDLENDDGVGDE